MKFFKQTNKYATGFTLIETFVAITVLIISIAGPLTLVMKGLSVSKSSKSQIVAMYLAQDAVEYVRNTRDENILTGNNWLYYLDNCVGVNSKCTVHTPSVVANRSLAVGSCPSGVCPVLKFNPTTKMYGYSSDVAWKDTLFTREINISEIKDNVEVLLTVTMSWQEGPNERDFTITEHLLNWQ